MRGERGMFFLPVVLLFALAVSAAFLLLPSFEHEEWKEARRLAKERARAAAEGAAALALHRGEDVVGLEVNHAVAGAKVERVEDGLVVRASAEVETKRGSVRFETEVRAARSRSR